MDSKTSLPLSHSLLDFYRFKLKCLSQEIVSDMQMRMDAIKVDTQSIHVFQTHLCNCENDLTALTLENGDLRAVLKDFLEENARLRLNRGLSTPDIQMYERLLHCLTQRPHVHQDNSAVLASMIKRCQDLESLAYKNIDIMNNESMQRHDLEVQVTELRETLHHETQDLTQRLKHHESQPSAEDFEYARSELARLQGELQLAKEELRCFRANTPPSRSRQGCTNGFTKPASDAQEDAEILHNVDKLTRKLESLERFAIKFMPEGEYGVAEFRFTVDKAHQRIADIESRLAKRICARQERVCE